MRLLTVSHFYTSHGGGIERVAGHLCRELAAAGHEVKWAASASDPALADAGVTVLPLTCINPIEAITGIPMPIPGWRGMRSLMRAVRSADAVLIHDALYVTSITAMIFAQWAGKPVILVQHIAELEFAQPLMRAIMNLATALITRPMLRAATSVVFISDAVRRKFGSVAMQSPAELVFNGVDTNIFHGNPEPGEAEAFRAAHGLGASDRLIAFVGRFVTKKGLAVVREVAAQQPDLTFALAGAGPINPDNWGLANVHVLGPLEPPDVARLLRSADIMLLPSTGEGYPLVVQETLACGVPVICGLDSAQADPAAEAWLHGVAIDLSDPKGTASRILPLLTEAKHDAAIKAEMAAYAATNYSWSGMAAVLADTCARGITRQPARAAAS